MKTTQLRNENENKHPHPVFFFDSMPQTISMKTDSPFGEVIYAYTRSQAIADGEQVKLPKTRAGGRNCLSGVSHPRCF